LPVVLTKLVKKERRAQVLKSPAFGCFKGIPAVNVTRGCPHACVYCYARGFPEAPPRGEVHLYANLPEMLERELARKRKLPAWVSFSTASDPFPPVDEVLAVTYRAMKLLLERGIGISFLTKGFVPPDFVALFQKYRHLVRARIGLVSLCPDYRKTFEPGAASPWKRLLNIRNLVGAGVTTGVRIDPLIPGFAGSAEALESLFKRLRAAGAKEVSVNTLVLRPAVAEQLAAELPPELAGMIFRHYRGQPWQKVITAAKTKLLPRAARETQYLLSKEVAHRYGLNCRICGCKNPDLPWESCDPGVIQENRASMVRAEQCTLFDVLADPSAR
jgi:DNA repair photolyase